MAKDLSSARRGRRHISRDYTSKLRSDINVRETERRAKMATMGMIGDFASGVADYAETLKTNMEGWKTLEAGGQELHKKGIEAGTIKEGTEFDLATSLGGDYAKEGISKWDMWTTQAPVTKQMDIGKDKFYGINVAQVGKLGESAGLLVDKKSNKSLYDFLKIGGDKSTASDPVSSIGELETMKKARPEEIPSVKTSSPVQNMITENNTSSSQSFTSTPKPSPLEYPKSTVQDVDWDSLLAGDQNVGEMPDFGDYFNWKKPPPKKTQTFGQSNIGSQNNVTNYRHSKYGWDEFDEDISGMYDLLNR